MKTLGYFFADRTEQFVNASAVGLGAIPVQFSNAGVPRIIVCAFGSLTATQLKYLQTHKEDLVVVWGIERFSFYLTERSYFMARSDANEFINI